MNGVAVSEENREALLETIKQMLQEYRADPFVEECLNQINDLQKILREGTPEQLQQAESLIVNLFALL